ncbi:purine-cytosine permease family protein [Pararobbsia silviterrae]|uniref:Purine-cytosine permease-like transporter n=1 Tax=Pararobbsia silviterrae TaxID=1792498 RepID=A0A494X0T3_9BURK|nr:cytosine permease [Pararobbsia silviterrae]RKP43922.1 purine-cytosine permease-like transporter [Pararobbsia silviterrae]
MAKNEISSVIEDHALESVPQSQRKGWAALSFSTAGITTTLVQLFFGGLATFVAGFRIALFAGIVVTVIGTLLGWATGHVAFRTGLSSTVLARRYGFGKKGSSIASLIYAFMIIGFLALENALLYKGTLFYFGLDDTIANRIWIYGILTVLWIALTTYGFAFISRVSSVLVVVYLIVLGCIIARLVATTGHSMHELVSYPALLPAEVLASMGASSDLGKFVFCLNLLIGSAGALALTDADLGRYARRSRDIGIAALAGTMAMDIFSLAAGGIIVYTGAPMLVDFYMAHNGLTREAANRAVLGGPDSIAAALLVFGGGFGALVMTIGQAKAQVLNTYSASLSLSNLFDVIAGWRPGRFVFVVLANVIGILMLYGSILEAVNSYITVLGVITTAFASVVVLDYYYVSRRFEASRVCVGDEDGIDVVNWAGVTTVVVASIAAHFVLSAYIPIQFVTTLVICAVLYPTLRLGLLKKLVRTKEARA